MRVFRKLQPMPALFPSDATFHTPAQCPRLTLPFHSRIDAFHGHADLFNEAAFAETLSYYGDTVDVKGGAAAIVARMKTCKSTNPTYSLSDLGEAFIIGETAAFISILGDAETITAPKKLVEYLFRKLYL
jgi:hypothetical protein